MMTLNDLLKVSQTRIKVLHGGTGKVVAYPLNSEKHKKYLDAEPMDVWADVDVRETGFGKSVTAIICCYMSSFDYEKANGG